MKIVPYTIRVRDLVEGYRNDKEEPKIQKLPPALCGRTFYYWVNEDKFSGDWINQSLNLVPNTRDLKVNGTFDLVNFFPVALDLSAFAAAWQDRVTYTVKPKWSSANTFNFCFADVPWSRAGSIQTTNMTTTAGSGAGAGIPHCRSLSLVIPLIAVRLLESVSIGPSIRWVRISVRFLLVDIGL